MNQAGAQYVVFAIRRNLYGISIHDVSEIIRLGEIQWIPNAREDMPGIIHLRGNIIPVISLHHVFSEEKRELHPKTRIIIVRRGDKEVGLIVDEVDRVKALPEEHISPPPPFSRNNWLTGIYHDQNDVIALLDLDDLL